MLRYHSQSEEIAAEYQEISRIMKIAKKNLEVENMSLKSNIPLERDIEEENTESEETCEEMEDRYEPDFDGHEEVIEEIWNYHYKKFMN